MPLNEAPTVLAVLLVAYTSGVAARVSATAQKLPDFSGRWRLDATRSDTPSGPLAGAGDAAGGAALQVIAQSRTELSVEYQGGRQNQKAVFILDGAEHTQDWGPQIKLITKQRSYWDGSVLVTETTAIQANGVFTTIVRRSLNPEGNEMIVETVLKAGDAEKRWRQVYARSSS